MAGGLQGKHDERADSPKHNAQRDNGEDVSNSMAPGGPTACKDIASLCEDADGNPGDDNGLRG